MPLSKFIYTGPDTNIKFLGKTKDGRSKYEFIDKYTGKSSVKIVSKETNRIIEGLMRRFIHED